jgi:hypothetical protein
MLEGAHKNQDGSKCTHSTQKLCTVRELGPEVRPWGEVRWSPVKASGLRPHGNSWNVLRSREKYFCKPAVLNGTWVGRRSGPPHLNLATRHNGKESARQCRRHKFSPSCRKKDPTCCGASKPTHYDYWACTLEHRSPTTEAQAGSGVREATTRRPHTSTRVVSTL